jgi:membrane protease YdiL (CAAX protease family)
MSSKSLAVHLRGHLLLFDKKSLPAYDGATGIRILFTVAMVEGARLASIRWLHVPIWLFLPLLLAFALVSIRLMAGLKLRQIGFRPWREWSPTEKSYFVQVLVIANVVFPALFAVQLRSRFAAPSVLWTAFVPYLFYGFYQEVIYRGLLQSELVRRWGAVAGILFANVLYTFGPLHWSYFSSRGSLAIPMFALIFAIGLFFGVLFRRSGNLWIVAIFHAIGNSYIVGSLGELR